MKMGACRSTIGGARKTLITNRWVELFANLIGNPSDFWLRLPDVLSNGKLPNALNALNAALDAIPYMPCPSFMAHC